jgi:hypothetical protein
VTYVAVLPVQNPWWANPNTRLSRTDVAIDSDTTGLRPGMSCLVEILIEELPDTLHLPLLATHSEGKETLVFVRSGDRTECRTGRYTEQVVRVLEDFSEGESCSSAHPTRPTSARVGPGHQCVRPWRHSVNLMPKCVAIGRA